MTAVSARIRRSVRYAALERESEPRLQGMNPRRARMSCSDRLRQPNGQDWTGSVGISPSGRFMVIEDTLPRKRWISREGIRRDAARWLLAGLAVLMAAVLLATLGAIGSASSRIRKLDDKITTYTEKNEQLRYQIAISAGDVSVCTEAVKLNLISSGGAKAIRLTAPGGASMIMEGSAGAESAGTELRGSRMQ